MNKTIKILISIIGIFIIINIAMAIFNICPPEGPWPTPPWCSSINISSELMFSGPSSLLKYDVSSNFTPSNLSYLPEENLNVHKNNFIFGIGMMDVWGVICDTASLCDEHTKEDVDSSFKRLEQLNTNLVMFTDFYWMDRNKDILNIEDGGARTVSPDEMKFLVDKAHKDNMKFMLITNLYEKNNSREVLNMKNPSKQDMDKLFDEWKKVILNQAKKGKYDYLVVDPRDMSFFFQTVEDNDYMNAKFVKLIPQIKQYYSGNICLWGFKSTINSFGGNYDCLIVDQDINDVVGGAGENLDIITKRWNDYLDDIDYNVTTFILILMPSYDGAMDKGWIEPVGPFYGDEYIKDYKEQALIYEGFFRAAANHPKIKGVISYGYWWNDRVYPYALNIFRNDLSHSIRDKDAESVFYKWSNILQ